MEDPDISEGDTPNDGAYSLNDKKKNMGDFGLQYLSFTYMKYFWGKWMSKSAIVNISIYCAVYMTKYNRLWISYIHEFLSITFTMDFLWNFEIYIFKVYKMQKIHIYRISGFFFFFFLVCFFLRKKDKLKVHFYFAEVILWDLIRYIRNFFYGTQLRT